jgi:hypothetical protein
LSLAASGQSVARWQDFQACKLGGLGAVYTHSPYHAGLWKCASVVAVSRMPTLRIYDYRDNVLAFHLRDPSICLHRAPRSQLEDFPARSDPRETSPQQNPSANPGRRECKARTGHSRATSCSPAISRRPTALATRPDIERSLRRERCQHSAAFFARVGAEVEEGSAGQTGLFAHHTRF